MNDDTVMTGSLCGGASFVGRDTRDNLKNRNYIQSGAPGETEKYFKCSKYFGGSKAKVQRFKGSNLLLIFLFESRHKHCRTLHTCNPKIHTLHSVPVQPSLLSGKKSVMRFGRLTICPPCRSLYGWYTRGGLLFIYTSNVGYNRQAC